MDPRRPHSQYASPIPSITLAVSEHIITRNVILRFNYYHPQQSYHQYQDSSLQQPHNPPSIEPTSVRHSNRQSYSSKASTHKMSVVSKELQDSRKESSRMSLLEEMHESQHKNRSVRNSPSQHISHKSYNSDN